MKATANSRVRRGPLGDSRERLIRAGIELFGLKGFGGVSTRELAAAAGVNIAGIAYHFGGKEQLHLACAEHIASFVSAGLLARLEGTMPSDASEAAAALRRTLSMMTHFLLGTPELASFARFMVREQLEPSAAFEVIYASVMEPMHKRLCALWSLATGEPAESEATKLRIFGLVGQILFFRIGRAAALRRLAWSEIGKTEVVAVETMVLKGLDALLASYGHGGSS